MKSSYPESTASQQDDHQGLSLKKTLLVLLGLLIVGGVILTLLVINKPEAKKSAPPKAIVSVEASKATIKDYPIIISTNGTISASTRGNLVAQVSGEITAVAPSFASGGQFNKGDILLEIDSRDFRAAVSSAQAQLSQAKAALLQEKASADQATKDWQRLGFDGQPNDLVLRKPQLAAAQAQLDSSKATYEKAQLDYSRTRIRAPYNGFIISKRVDLGQFVTTGSVLGEIFSDQGLEAQLPLNQDQFSQLNIQDKPAVVLTATLGGRQHNWDAQIVRADSVFDTTTRQLNVTAKITQAVSDQGLQLRIGQYVSATIAGRIAPQSMVIPNQAIREGSYVFIFDEGILRKRNINIVWQDSNNSVVEGVNAEELVVTTSLGGALSGADAKLLGDQQVNKKPKKQDEEK